MGKNERRDTIRKAIDKVIDDLAVEDKKAADDAKVKLVRDVSHAVVEELFEFFDNVRTIADKVH